MPDVRLQHVIFTRVEKAYSPNGYSGYQIVYQSPSLGAGAAQIEKRIQCFQANKQQLNRYQFFWIGQEQAVCTRSISLIAPDPEVIDRDQRDAFLVHALVMSRADFATLRNDPFVVFETAENAHMLIESVPQMLSYLRKETPLPEQVTIPVRKQIAVLPTDWSNEQIQQLYRLGEAASRLSEQKKSVLMIADHPADMFRLLNWLLILLPPEERAACTFDTFVDSCTPSAGSFWAIGGTKMISNSGLLPMRLAEHAVAQVRHNTEPSAYTLWFSQALQRGLDSLNADLYSAQVVAEAFKSGKALPNEVLSGSALQTFLQLHRQTIDASLSKILAAVMEKSLAEAFLPRLSVALDQQHQLSIAAQGTCEPRVLANIMYYWLLNESPEWKKWEDVLKFAERAEDASLLLLASLKARPMLSMLPFMGYEKQRQRAIQALLATGKLPIVISELLGGQQPQVRPFMMSYMQLSDDEFQMLVTALLQQNAGQFLQDLCVQRVARLQNPKMVQGLLKAVTAAKNAAPEFVQTCQNHPLVQAKKGKE